MKELEYTTQSVPKDKRFCTICGKVKRLHCFEGDSTHCSECREKMLHTRLNGRSIPVVLFVLLVAAFSVFLSVYTVPYCIDLFKAEAAVRDKRLADACTVYASAVSSAAERNAAMLSGGKKNGDGTYVQPSGTFFEAGTRTWVRYLKTYAELYSEYQAAVLAEGSLHADEIKKEPSLARLSEAKTAFEETEAFAQEIDYKYMNEEPTQEIYRKILAELSAHADASDSRYVKGYIEMYKAEATRFFKPDDLAASTAYYERALEYLPDEFMNVYNEEASAAIEAGEYETAIGIYEKMLRLNKDYTGAYPSIANAAFLAGNEEKFNSALAHYDENDPLRLRLEMRFALRAEDVKKAEEVRARANKALKPEADKIFGELLSKQTITQTNKTKLTEYVEFQMWDAAYALVTGKTDEAFRIAYEEGFNNLYYYSYITGDSTVFSQSVINMATLCAELVQNEEAIELIKQISNCDRTTQSILNGELTVRDVFVEGKAEIL